MKLTTALLFSIIALTHTASAKKHRLCCCATYDDCGLFGCDSVTTQAVIDNSKIDNTKDDFVRSDKTWDKEDGAPCGGKGNWMYARSDFDDGYIGGNEVSELCEQQGASSRCFTPRSGWKNANPKIKGRGVEVEQDSSAAPIIPVEHYAKPKFKPTKKKPKKMGDKKHWPEC
ncbi:hypothetical protein FKW77_004724 [Venturia effusa]|uniref:Uncharacterized protein n=1 Tax=Venturia effusa TaxID=50376 RepID=A0A517LAX4_9PEZI|nr:hypothetical protein FKW77_004724 [Venturia effusa]